MKTVLSYYERNKAKFRGYYERNKAKYAERSARWWKEHPDQLRAKWRRRSKSPAGKAKAKRHRERNLEKVRAARRKWQRENWSHRQKYYKEWAAKNAASLQAKHKAYWSTRGLAVQHQRRALIKASTTNLRKIQDWNISVKSKRNATCYWCGDSIRTSEIHFDHIVPLCKGGAHSIENLCVSCAPCNLSKQKRHPTAWIQVGQQMLAL